MNLSDEGDKYYFDAEAGEKAIRWIEKNLCHYEGVYNGKPFLLMGWQKVIIRHILGWKRSDNGLRRFQFCYTEGGKGLGKSPWMTACAAYLWLKDGEAASECYSMSSTFEQANITFECARIMFERNPVLDKYIKRTTYRLDYKTNPEGKRINSKWKIISGEPKGKHGMKPTICLLDELHELEPNASKLFNAMVYNMGKRLQPMFFMGTNAGERKEGLAWELHERAVKAIKGNPSDPTFYATIFCAGEKDDAGSRDTWVKSIPSLGKTVSETVLEQEWTQAKGSPANEATFKRLRLSIWGGQSAAGWVNMADWDACATGFNSATLANCPCVIALDSAFVDDLVAVSQVWVDEQTFYARSKCWIPKQTAYKYEDRDGISYSQWAAEKHVSLLDNETIDDGVQDRIARYIIKQAKQFKVDALCYDPRYAKRIIRKCEEAGIACVSISQNFTLSPAMMELERRLKARSIILSKNPCLRWQAENLSVVKGRYGDIRPSKEGAGGSYAGLRSRKIDAMQALITAMSRAMKLGELEERKMWQGSIVSI